MDADGDGAGVATEENFVYDGSHITLVFDDNGNQTHRYFHGPQIDQILAEETANGDTHWALTDHQGSVRDVIDNSSTVLNHIVYDSFGQVTSETDPAFDFRFGYTGRERDEESGMLYYRARYNALPTTSRLPEEERGSKITSFPDDGPRLEDPPAAEPRPEPRSPHMGHDGSVTGGVLGEATDIIQGCFDNLFPPYFEHRSRPPDPLPEANGYPHTIIEKPGPDGQYTTHHEDGTWKQYRSSGKDHGKIPRPNVKENRINRSPDGTEFISKPRVRRAEPEDIPGGNSQ